MNYLITGVSRGLGLEIIKTLLKNSNNKIWGISRKSSFELDNLLKEYSTNLFWHEYDLNNYEGFKNLLLKEFINNKIKINGFVNNAAIAYDDIITNLKYERLIEMYNVNVFAPMIITKYMIRNFIFNNTEGSIVHISSISAHTGYNGLAMYASTKAALEAFSKNTSREWGNRGIRSNTIVAGFMETDMSLKLTEEQKARIYKRNSLKKPVDLHTIAETVAFLLSDKSKSITGQNIFVDSGTI